MFLKKVASTIQEYGKHHQLKHVLQNNRKSQLVFQTEPMMCDIQIKMAAKLDNCINKELGIVIRFFG